MQSLDQHDKEEHTPSVEADAIRRALQQLQSEHAENRALRAHLRDNGLNQHIKTEPDARLMRTAQGGKVAYNVRTDVDAAHGLIVHYEMTQDTCDNRQLLPMAQTAKVVLVQESLTVVADKGYSNGAQFEACAIASRRKQSR